MPEVELQAPQPMKDKSESYEQFKILPSKVIGEDPYEMSKSQPEFQPVSKKLNVEYSKSCSP